MIGEWSFGVDSTREVNAPSVCLSQGGSLVKFAFCLHVSPCHTLVKPSLELFAVSPLYNSSCIRTLIISISTVLLFI